MCLYSGCQGEEIYARGLCKSHYMLEWSDGNLARYPKAAHTSELVHGTPGGYTNHKCRCDECKKANNEMAKLYRDKRRGPSIKLSETPKYNSRRMNAEYAEQKATRNGRCDCCGRVFEQLVLDHDHLTGEFRGFLCHACNTGIGKLGDNLDGLARAVSYLENSPH